MENYENWVSNTNVESCQRSASWNQPEIQLSIQESDLLHLRTRENTIAFVKEIV
jgi:hypothetical protein